MKQQQGKILMRDWNSKQPTASPTSGEAEDLPLEVARRRLLESAGQADALETIREIVTGLLGSEEIALFKVEEEGKVLSLLWSFGIDSELLLRLDAWRSPVLQRVIEGEVCLQGAFEGGHDGSLDAGFKTLVPILLAGQTVAVLAICRLLPQKSCMDHSDLQVLRLLSDDAGKVLFCEEIGLKRGKEGYGRNRQEI